ncbi:MAG: hypothetical protein FIB08_04565 [Candidatus Methanoperedens sp.]|nr:hypothetical protein [Candidatus Methanoperedens sp.]
MKQNNEEKRSGEPNLDIYGRIEALDQSLRSVNNRLRAVEKRLSSRNGNDEGLIIINDIENKDIHNEIEELKKFVENLGKSVEEIKKEGMPKDIEARISNLQAEVSKLASKTGFTGGTNPKAGAAGNMQGDLLKHEEDNMAEFRSIEAQLSDIEHRIIKLDNVNRITIGKINVPVELSGLMAAVVLIGTGFFIATDQWGIIRAWYYPTIIGILFGAVAVIKVLLAKRK